MIDGKQRRRVVQHPERTTAAKERGTGGRDKGKGARLRTVGGDIGGGGEIGARVEGRQARRGEKVRRVGVVWVQLLARAYIYSSYI